MTSLSANISSTVTSSTNTATPFYPYFVTPPAGHVICKIHGEQEEISLSVHSTTTSVTFKRFCWQCFGEFLEERFPVVHSDEGLIFDATKEA